jgi:hypothetical protein
VSALAPAVLIVSLLLIAFPFGVTDEGSKPHVASDGKPLQPRVTAESNPFTGVTVKVAVPLCPATMLKLEGLTESW